MTHEREGAGEENTCPVCGDIYDHERTEEGDGAELREDATQCRSSPDDGEQTVYVHWKAPRRRELPTSPDLGVAPVQSAYIPDPGRQELISQSSAPYLADPSENFGLGEPIGDDGV